MTVHGQFKDENIEISLLKDVPLSFAKSNVVMPIRRENGGLLGAVGDERGTLALRELAKHHGLKPLPQHMSRDAVLELINRFYGRLGSAEEVMEDLADEDLASVATEFESPRDILELTEEAPIIRLLNALFQQAAKEMASDIHIEPYEKELEVRLRVDGILRKMLAPPKIIQEALVSRIKIMASLDIAEKRLPQDGRIRLLVGGRDIDIRVSIIPTVYGERAVLRFLYRRQGLFGMTELGLQPDEEARFEELILRINGIVLVTGPTGSGKTTTLYAALQRVYSEESNILTIEDPVEYQLAGIGQINVKPRIGLSFASGLRSMLRQDPDVIMVGEIRDRETAEVAIHASLTGHLVLSTLHTNDSASAIARLMDMGVEPYLLASSLAGVLAQRLVRLICPHCKRDHTPTPLELSYFGTPLKALWKGAGCDKCNGTGYIGRVGLFELLTVDNNIRQMITAKKDASAIKKVAISKGTKTLRADGLRKAAAGLTTLEEVLRVTQKDHADIPV